MSTAARRAPSVQRDWWLRALAVFQSPGAVFAAMRDDSTEAADARQEPVTAIVILAGISGVLTTSLARRLLDDPHFDGLSVAVWAFLGGAFYGLLVYWLGGLVVHALARGFGAMTSYRQARHVVGFAAAPVALSLLLVWPVRIAIYGGDLFRTGGSDHGLGDVSFDALFAAAFAWMLGLVFVGVRALNGWSWPRRG
ncbi:MAG: YIP1 family protein [Actinobacteria bacterium]|nr:MAG: YIP1 family protein [Actinomycetota bacterium]